MTWVRKGHQNITYGSLPAGYCSTSIFKDIGPRFHEIICEWYVAPDSIKPDFSRLFFGGIKQLEQALRLIQEVRELKEKSSELFSLEKLSHEESVFYSALQEQHVTLRKSTAALCGVILKDLITLQNMTHKSISSIIKDDNSRLPYTSDVPKSVLLHCMLSERVNPLHFDQYIANGVMQHCEELVKEELLLPEEEVCVELYKTLILGPTPR